MPIKPTSTQKHICACNFVILATSPMLTPLLAKNVVTTAKLVWTLPASVWAAPMGGCCWGVLPSPINVCLLVLLYIIMIVTHATHAYSLASNAHLLLSASHAQLAHSSTPQLSHASCSVQLAHTTTQLTHLANNVAHVYLLVQPAHSIRQIASVAYLTICYTMANVCSNALLSITLSHQVYVIDVMAYVRHAIANTNV
mgnify:CR=1 FL=1